MKKTITLISLLLFLFTACQYSNKGEDNKSNAKVDSTTTSIKITDPKVGEWVYYEGGPTEGPTARQITDVSYYGTADWKAYSCSMDIVKEDRISYKRYATKEEIAAVLPLK
jgi:hypothetical protein